MARKLVKVQPAHVEVGDLVEGMDRVCRKVEEIGQDDFGVTFRYEGEENFCLGVSFPVNVQKWEPDDANSD